MSFAARILVDALAHPAAITDEAGRVLVSNARWRISGTAEGNLLTGTDPGCPAHGDLPGLVRAAAPGTGPGVALACRCADQPAGSAVRITALESTCGAQRRLITIEGVVTAPGVPVSPLAGPPSTGTAAAGEAITGSGAVVRDADPSGPPHVRMDFPDRPGDVRMDFPGRPGSSRTVHEPVARDRLAGSPSHRGGGNGGPSPRLVPLPPGRVLLAEDDEVNRTVLQRMINMLGVDCDVVRDGAAAVTALLGPESYDLVLLDVHMPGVDGPEAARRARAAGYRKPILALTATTLPEDRELCLAAGMDGHLGKPITLPELRRALEPYLTAPPEQPAPDDGEAPPEAPEPDDGETLPESPDPGEILSLRQLHELEEQLEGRELVAMTVGTFLAELDGRRQSMANALSAGDNHHLGAVAHTLKSSSALLGAGPLAEACARVERMAAAAADPGALDAAVSEVDRTAAATAIAMADYLTA